MLDPSDRIWIVEKEFEEGGWIRHEEMVVQDQFLADEAKTDGWRVTEYIRVPSDACGTLESSQ